MPRMSCNRLLGCFVYESISGLRSEAKSLSCRAGPKLVLIFLDKTLKADSLFWTANNSQRTRTSKQVNRVQLYRTVLILNKNYQAYFTAALRRGHTFELNTNILSNNNLQKSFRAAIKIGLTFAVSLPGRTEAGRSRGRTPLWPLPLKKRQHGLCLRVRASVWCQLEKPGRPLVT